MEELRIEKVTAQELSQIVSQEVAKLLDLKFIQHLSEKPSDTPRLLSIKEVAERIGVTKPHIHKLLNNGDLTRIHLEGVVRISEEELSQYIEIKRQSK